MSEAMDNTAMATGRGGGETAPEQDEKTFSQNDVNRIVSERLAKEKFKAEAGLAQREQALDRRAFLLDAKETLTEKGLSHELLEALNTTSREAFEKSLEILLQQLEKTRQTAMRPPTLAAGTGTNPMMGTAGPDVDVRRAFGLRHRE